MRVLVLDDDPERHRKFRRWLIGTNADHAFTPAQARDFLRGGRRYDLVCLDNDMDMVDTDETGEHVADYIAHHMPTEKMPRAALVHSFNDEAAERIATKLDEAGIPVTIQRFSDATGITLWGLIQLVAM
jgi:CheY-like chemotaxis protein